MKKIAMMLSCLLCTCMSMWAQGFPTISDAETTKWYLIQFTNGGNALTAKTDGAQISTSAALGNAPQMWKVTGNATDGYQFTNKEGLTLYVNSAAKNEMVHASANVAGKVAKFTLTETSNNAFEIPPKGNSNIAMNLWGGPAENRGVGLWDNADQNNPVTFNEVNAADDFNRISIIPYPASLTVTNEDVRLAVNGQADVHFYGRTGGVIPTPDEVYNKIIEIAGGAK